MHIISFFGTTKAPQLRTATNPQTPSTRETIPGGQNETSAIGSQLLVLRYQLARGFFFPCEIIFVCIPKFHIWTDHQLLYDSFTNSTARRRYEVIINIKSWRNGSKSKRKNAKRIIMIGKRIFASKCDTSLGKRKCAS